MYRTGILGALLISAAFPALCSAQDTSVASVKLFDRVVSNEELQRYRGGSDTKVLNFMDIDAALKENTARSNITGGNIVTNGAFTNASGLSTVIQNSGNNVIIQNATILNLEIR
jgi:hypothetical protein